MSDQATLVPLLPFVYRWVFSRKPCVWYYPEERERGDPKRPENQRSRWWARPRSSPPLLLDEWWPPYKPPPVCVVWEATRPEQWERHIARDLRKAMEQRDAIEVAQTRRPSGLRCELEVWIETGPFSHGREAEAHVPLAGLAAVHSGGEVIFLGQIEGAKVRVLRDQWKRVAKRWLEGRPEETIRCGLVYVRVGPSGEVRPLSPPTKGTLRCPRCKLKGEVKNLATDG